MHPQAKRSNTFLGPSHSDLLFTRDKVARIKDGRNLKVRVNRGSVWITHQGSTEDVVLQSGDSFRIVRNGLTLMSACGCTPFALVSIEQSVPVKPPPRSRIAERFWNWWTGLGGETTPRWYL